MKLFRNLPSVAAILMVVALLAVPRLGRAQAMLGVEFDSIGLPDTVQEGSLVHVSFNVVNHSTTQPFSGSLVLNGGLLDSLGLDSIAGDTLFNYYIGPGATVHYSFSIPIFTRNTFVEGPFRIGGNVVVVWPSVFGSSTFLAVDSLVDSVYVLPLSIPRPENSPRFSLNLYPNPAVNQIQLAVLAPGRIIEQVRVYDVAGRTLFLSEGETDRIDLSNLQPGMYFLAAYMSNALRPEIYKIQKK